LKKGAVAILVTAKAKAFRLGRSSLSTTIMKKVTQATNRFLATVDLTLGEETSTLLKISIRENMNLEKSLMPTAVFFLLIFYSVQFLFVLQLIKRNAWMLK